jgi:hypothetical protein
MTEKEIEVLKTKSLCTSELSHKNKDNITTAELNNFCASVKKQLRLKKEVIVMILEVKE